MRFLYTLLFILAIPFILLRLVWRSCRLPAYRHRWQERFAWFDAPERAGGLWVHAVSFGESVAAIPLIKQFQKRHPSLPITVTNMTPTGSEKIRATFGNEIFNVYVPYDLPSIMRRFIKKIKPDLVVIIETELWPNMLHALKKAKIPVMLANGRLSAHSFANYSKVKSMTKSMFTCFTKLLVQTEPEAKRYIALGCAPEKIKVTGSIKFDISIPADLKEKAQRLRQALGKERPIVIAASTHEGEEEHVLEAFALAKKDVHDLLLMIVPRHPDRFAKVEKLCKSQGYTLVKRSEKQVCSKEVDIFLGDTMGEMLLFYGAADVAFVGGSFIPVGGHNVLEPAALAKATITGPHMHNFLLITDILLQAKGIRQVDTVEQLAKVIVELMQIPSLREQLGENANKVVAQNRGALNKHLEVMDSLLGSSLLGSERTF